MKYAKWTVLFAVAALMSEGIWSPHCHAAGEAACSWAPLGVRLSYPGSARVFARFQDRLFLGGQFTIPGDEAISNLAAWDGEQWSSVGRDMPNGSISSMIVFDDGFGPALYVAGDFTMAGGQPASHLARWDGRAWEPVEPVSDDSPYINALAVFDDGNGPRLYAAGSFTSIGGVTANNIARLDGSTWSSLGTGLQGDWPSHVTSLAVFDDGTGPALYAGGFFQTAGGIETAGLARWNGAEWSSIGALAVSGNDGYLNALAIFDDGSGPALYIGGYFWTVGGTLARNIARWNGRIWSDVGGSMAAQGIVRTLAALNVKEQRSLFVGGHFTSAGVVPALHAARWDGIAWSPLGEGLNAYPLAAHAELHDSQPQLFMAGEFVAAGTVAAPGIARWDGRSWHAVGDGVMGPDTSHPPRLESVVEFKAQDGDQRLYVGGRFASLNGTPCNSIAQFDGEDWSPVGGGLWWNSKVPAAVFSFAVFDDGNGPALYVGGAFGRAGGVDALNLARWDGESWSGVGGGADSWVYSLCVYDDGSGPALFAAGVFASIGGKAIHTIGKWDGEMWHSLGSGLTNDTADPAVFTMHVHNGALYVGGDFDSAGGVPCNSIARWDGRAWSSVGGGMTGPPPWVTALTTHDGLLYAAGYFTHAGGVPANNIARWDGATWWPLGAGIAGGGEVTTALATYGLPGQADLYAVGYFTLAGGIPVNHAARWDGQQWHSLGSGIDHDPDYPLDVPYDACVTDVFGPSSLVVTGAFAGAGGQRSLGIAQWTCRQPGDVNGDGLVDVDDLIAVILAWGDCAAPPAPCPADIAPVSGDGHVNVDDFLQVILHWG